MSQQQLIDCSDDFGNEGCEGGLPSKCFRYYAENPAKLLSAYPYYGQKYECSTQLESMENGLMMLPDGYESYYY